MAWSVFVAAGALLLAGAVIVARGTAAESVRHRRDIAERYHLDEVTAGFFHIVELPYQVATQADRIDAGVLGGLDVAVVWRVVGPDDATDEHHTAVLVKDPQGLPESSIERAGFHLPGAEALDEAGEVGWIAADVRAGLAELNHWFRIDTAGDQLMLVERTDETGPSHGQVDHMFRVAFGALGRAVQLPPDPAEVPADPVVPVWAGYGVLALGMLALAVGPLLV